MWLDWVAGDARKCPLNIQPSGATTGRFRKIRGWLESVSGFELALHAMPTLARGGFGSAGATPVGFEAHGQAVAVAFQGGELSGPIDDACAHGGPFVAIA